VLERVGVGLAGMKRDFMGQQLGDEIAVAGDGAGQHAGLLREFGRVDEIAVVTERELDVRGAAVDRLRIAPRTRTGRRIARVSDREIARASPPTCDRRTPSRRGPCPSSP
jgi:hypothetical protein